MTEQEWLESSSPPEMLDYLGGYYGKSLKERKYRLFACTCFRLNAIGIDYQIRHVNSCEEWADGGSEPNNEYPNQSFYVSYQSAFEAAMLMVVHHRSIGQKKELHSSLLREIFGNPWKDFELKAKILSYRTPLIVDLASAAYKERINDYGHLNNERLLVLSDALEEAGWDEECPDCKEQKEEKERPHSLWPIFCLPCHRGNNELLSYLRSPGPHVRGCWALDLILGKE